VLEVSDVFSILMHTSSPAIRVYSEEKYKKYLSLATIIS